MVNARITILCLMLVMLLAPGAGLRVLDGQGNVVYDGREGGGDPPPQQMQQEGDDETLVLEQDDWNQLVNDTVVPWWLDGADGVRDGVYNGGRDPPRSRALVYVIDSPYECPQNYHARYIREIIRSIVRPRRLKLYPVFDCNGYARTTQIIHQLGRIRRIKSRPQFLNLSFRGRRNDIYNAVLEDMVHRGFTLVAAAGNDNLDACDYSPQSAAGVIVVGALGERGERADFSNHGPCVTNWEPGLRLPVLGSRISGTSFAAPLLLGRIAGRSNDACVPRRGGV